MSYKNFSLGLGLRSHWIIASIAFIIAFLLWIAVVGGEKIESSKKIGIEYQIPEETIISSQVPEEINVRMRGPRAFLKDILNKKLSYTADLSKLKPGSHEITVEKELLNLPLGIDILSLAPKRIKISLDPLITKRVPVRPTLSTQLPPRYKVKSVVSNPSTVELRGALTKLSAINSIPTEVILLSDNTLKQKFEVNVNVEEEIGLFVNEENRRVSIEVELEGPSIRQLYKGIPVHLKVGDDNNLAKVNTKKKNISLHPATVNLLLEGPKQIIETLRQKDIELWVHLKNFKKGNYRTRLIWKLPPELTVINRSSDSIAVFIP